MIAAKLGARVVTIEPFYDNIIRFHKAALQENVTHRITLIRNALFNKRNEIKLLSENQINVGGQSLVENMNRVFERSELAQNKYLVETILFDDIIDYLPRSKGAPSQRRLLAERTIIKIDIEGLEPYVIPTATSLFEILSVQIVFMEWGKMPHTDRGKVEEMIQFLTKRNFVPRSIDNIELSLERWASWPFDMHWIKKDLV